MRPLAAALATALVLLDCTYAVRHWPPSPPHLPHLPHFQLYP